MNEIKDDDFKEVETQYAPETRPSGEALFSIVRASCNRLALSVKLLEKDLNCFEGDNIKILVGNGAIMLQKNEKTGIHLMAKGHKYLVYNKDLVDQIADVMGLEFTARSSYSAYNYEVREYKGAPALYIASKDFI